MRDSAPDDDSYETVKQAVLSSVVRHFSPEFVNRIDEIVVFHPLGKEEILGIAQLQIDLLNRRLADNELQIRVSPDMLRFIAEAGFDPVYGARPLKRAIQNRIENPLAQHVLAGEFGPGSNIDINLGADGNLKFSASATDEEEIPRLQAK